MAKLKITYINVGQGDSTLIQCPNGKNIMIDCGTTQGADDDTLKTKKDNRDKWLEEWTKLKRMKPSQYPINYKTKLADALRNKQTWEKTYKLELKENNEDTLTEIHTQVQAILPNNKQIDCLILTHHDADHHNKVRSLTALGVSFKEIYYSGPISKYSALRSNFYTGVNGNVGKYISVTINGKDQASQNLIENSNDVTRICQLSKLNVLKDGANDVEIDILAGNVHSTPNDGAPGATRTFHYSAHDINGRSLVVLARIGKSKIMIAGDATVDTEAALLKLYPGALKVGTLRVAHHGSESSSSDAFIDATKPDTVFVSCAKYNVHGLPRQDIMNRYLNRMNKDGVADGNDHELPYYTDKTTFKTPSVTVKKPIWSICSIGSQSKEYS